VLQFGAAGAVGQGLGGGGDVVHGGDDCSTSSASWVARAETMNPSSLVAVQL